MKRTFLARRNALLSSASLSWGALALLFTLFVLFVRLVAPNFFLQAFVPAFRTAESIDAVSHSFFNSFGDTAALAARNEQLVNENAALASENAALREKEASLIALVGGGGTQGTVASGILAGVVARPPASPYDTLVLAAGRSAGVTLGQEIFGAGNVPLGIISAVTNDFSRATLFSAPEAQIEGWVGKTSLPLRITGAGGGTLRATVSRSAQVAVGDVVFAPGPGMLPIGSVVRIDSDLSAPGVTLRIMPAQNPFSLSWVVVRDTGAAFRNSFSIATSTP
ncbi:MAG: rod shape-determining protein MreC [Candidatus Pacebacteria bacterium]|nr:rod shape-determining protein MreC [Candidatus Paceibacterota bacterium]